MERIDEHISDYLAVTDASDNEEDEEKATTADEIKKILSYPD